MKPKNIVILGATGSIGTQTLDVVRRLPKRLCVVGMSAHSNAEQLKAQATEFQVSQDALAWGDHADLVSLATMPEADLIVVAVAGAVGTQATLAALEAGKDVALATKEVLVAAGQIVMQAAKTSGVHVLPIDSEHSALFQCLQGSPVDSVAKLWITASGGPFREWSSEQMARATVADALHHPTWPTMGRKITIDSATLMNKGLEMIEARWLFDVPVEQIEIVVHPQSVVHSLVEFRDGSVLSQMGLPDMRLPIEYALLYPERINIGLPYLNIGTLKTALTFAPPDEKRFPSLGLARRAAKQGGTYPAVLNAANEAAVGLFLKEKITFLQIMALVAGALDAHQPSSADHLSDIIEADRWTRDWTLAAAARL